MDSLKCFRSFQSLYWRHLNHQGRQFEPTHFSVDGRGGGGEKHESKNILPRFNSGFGHIIFKRYQTENNFQMLLIKWKRLYVFKGPFKTWSQGEIISNRNVSNRYNKAKRNKKRNFRTRRHCRWIFFSLYISLMRSWGSPMQSFRQKVNPRPDGPLDFPPPEEGGRQDPLLTPSEARAIYRVPFTRPQLTVSFWHGDGQSCRQNSIRSSQLDSYRVYQKYPDTLFSSISALFVPDWVAWI